MGTIIFSYACYYSLHRWWLFLSLTNCQSPNYTYFSNKQFIISHSQHADTDSHQQQKRDDNCVCEYYLWPIKQPFHFLHSFDNNTLLYLHMILFVQKWVVNEGKGWICMQPSRWKTSRKVRSESNPLSVWEMFTSDFFMLPCSYLGKPASEPADWERIQKK